MADVSDPSEEDKAAAKLQAVKRGRDSRVAVAKQKDEENAAATKLAAVKRGKDSRAVVQQKRAEAAAKAAAEQQAAEDEAKAKLGAVAKGYTTRKAMNKEKEELKAKATRIQAGFRGKQDRAEVEVKKERAANDPAVKAEKYLKKHKLMALFELMGESLVRDKPSDPSAYLISYLTQLKEKSDPTSPLNFFEEQDVDTLFSMYDASNTGLTPKQCREALNAIGLESVKVPAGEDRFDKTAFMALVK